MLLGSPCQASKVTKCKGKERAPSDVHESRHFESQRPWSGNEGGFPEVNFGGSSFRWGRRPPSSFAEKIASLRHRSELSKQTERW
jgi:hypothetical protein